jgi:hypothetical protein
MNGRLDQRPLPNQQFCRPLRGVRLFCPYLGLKPQAAVATLWRALAIRPTSPKNLAATKALRSRAESYYPFGISPTHRFGSWSKGPYETKETRALRKSD